MAAAVQRAILALFLSLTALGVRSEELRFAAFNAELTRRNPGILVRDLLRASDPQVGQVTEIIQRVRPDILLLSGFDYDVQGLAIALFREELKTGRTAAGGIDYPYWFTAPVNSGVPSGLDLDGDGRLATADDAWGFGYFPGQEGMAILSRFPIDQSASRTFQKFRWAELNGALLPVRPDGSPWPDALAQASMRLSTASHWDVAITAPDGPIRVLAAHPTPPVFDGPEDTNGRRNHDEVAFWLQYLSGAEFRDDQERVKAFDDAPFVVMGDFNADPVDGSGIRSGINALLSLDGVIDPLPTSAGGAWAAPAQLGANVGQVGDPALDTADWPDEAGKPGNMRVDYVLPSTDFTVTGAGVFWPAPDDPLHRLVVSGAERGSRHRLVWVDISR